MDKNTFRGERLKSARLLRGLTLAALQDITGISKQSISLYENDENEPGYERGFKLAQALRVPYEFFLQKDNCETKTSATYFRSLTSASKLSRTSQSLKLEYVAKMYEALLTYIDFPPLNLPKVKYRGGYSIYNDADCRAMCLELEQIAMQVREYWGLGIEPIKDLQYVLESNGIIVTGFDTNEDGIDAFSQRTVVAKKDVCFIAVDQGTKPEGRIRFDMAHELAHILIHPWSEDIDSISREEFKTREFEANVFASAFLLPRESFGKDVQAYPTDIKFYLWLKTKWKSSMQSMMYRSHQLGYISNNQFQYMMRQVSKNGWRKKEPGDEPFLLNENIFQGAIDLLKNEHILTPSQILKLFSNYGVCLYPEEIENLLHLYEDTLNVKDARPQILQLKVLNSDIAK